MSKARPEPRTLPRRFYAAVAVQQQAAAFSIQLDGKTVMTPGKQALAVSGLPLAEAIAEEWRAQETVIDADRMPLTRLAHLALDRMQHDRAALLEDIAGYCETDLVCYRDTVPELQALQAQHFDPLLDWMRTEFAAAFSVTHGVMPIAQSPTACVAVRTEFAAAADGELAPLAMLVPILGSVVLTLAIWKRRLSIEEALVAARLDEDFQAQHWGADPESKQAWANKCRDARAAAFFLDIQAAKKSA